MRNLFTESAASSRQQSAVSNSTWPIPRLFFYVAFARLHFSCLVYLMGRQWQRLCQCVRWAWGVCVPMQCTSASEFPICTSNNTDAVCSKRDKVLVDSLVIHSFRSPIVRLKMSGNGGGASSSEICQTALVSMGWMLHS